MASQDRLMTLVTVWDVVGETAESCSDCNKCNDLVRKIKLMVDQELERIADEGRTYYGVPTENKQEDSK